MTSLFDDPCGALPDGWALAPITDTFEINPPKPGPETLSPSEPVTFVPMSAVDSHRGEIIAPEERPFGDVRKGYTAFAEGDVIMAKITPCLENGKAAIAHGLKSNLGFGSSEFHVFRPRGAVQARYLFHYIRQVSFRETSAENMTGTAGQARVPADYLKRLMLPIPPLSEQRRIAEKVDALLAEVNAAKDQLARVPLILKRFRQSVLAAACSGRLTEDWRQTNSQGGTPKRSIDPLPRENASEFEQSIDYAWDGPELPASWTHTQMGSLANLVTSGSRGWGSYYSESGPLFIRSQDINTDQLNTSGVAHVTLPKNTEGKRTLVQECDILITITGANVTKAALVDQPLGEAYVSQHVALVRPSMPSMARWLHLWIVSPHHGRKQLLDAAYGAGKPGLNLDNIRDLFVATPPPEERDEISWRVSALLRTADTIEQRLHAAIACAEKLSQTILAKAFRGELVPTEAELARAEGRDYETAEALLERIRREREGAASPMKSRLGTRGRRSKQAASTR
jgi:type I restriction enzyme, S subunit